VSECGENEIENKVTFECDRCLSDQFVNTVNQVQTCADCTT